jgi:hypothetical protein
MPKLNDMPGGSLTFSPEGQKDRPAVNFPADMHAKLASCYKAYPGDEISEVLSAVECDQEGSNLGQEARRNAFRVSEFSQDQNPPRTKVTARFTLSATYSRHQKGVVSQETPHARSQNDPPAIPIIRPNRKQRFFYQGMPTTKSVKRQPKKAFAPFERVKPYSGRLGGFTSRLAPRWPS